MLALVVTEQLIYLLLSNIVFELIEAAGYPVQTKGGDVAGYSSLIGFVPDLKLGKTAVATLQLVGPMY